MEESRLICENGEIAVGDHSNREWPARLLFWRLSLIYFRGKITNHTVDLRLSMPISGNPKIFHRKNSCKSAM